MTNIVAMYYWVMVTDKDSNLFTVLLWPEGDLRQRLESTRWHYVFGTKPSYQLCQFFPDKHNIRQQILFNFQDT